MEKNNAKNQFDPSNTEINDVYTNNSHIIMNNGEISIVFLHDINTPPTNRKPLIRVTMTHANFVSFVRYCSYHSDFIQSVYDDKLLKLEDLYVEGDPKIAEAIEKFQRHVVLNTRTDNVADEK